jgi:predicted HAD superfamily Cof-like phosphohydrolase
MKFNFADAIAAFNRMYKLPVASAPTLEVGVPVVRRLEAFKRILLNEVDEVEDIIAKIKNDSPDAAVLTDLADWLGDIQVYCASEMAKFGIPQPQVLEIIMNSNMSKLGADGLPIYDDDGKVQKGPNYWKPEPAIYVLITRLINKAQFVKNIEQK